MAESYRGLTIQIGGDTTKLSQALKIATQAARSTDSELRKLSDAVKLDPSSLQAANLQMGAMASSAAATAMKLATLNDAIEQIGQRQFDGTSVKELSDNTKNAQLNAELALASYNKLTDSLAQMNTQMSSYTQKVADAAGVDFGEKMKASFREGAAGAEVIAGALKDLPSLVIQPTEDAIDSFATKLGNFGTRFEKLTADAQKFKAQMDAATTGDEKAKAQSRFERTQTQIDNLLETVDKAIDKFSKFDGQVFNVENDNTSIQDLRKAFEAMPDSIRPSQASINEFLGEVQRLKTAWAGATTELEKATIIAQFQQATNEATKLSATITNLSREMANMKVPSDLLRSMYEQTEGIKALGDAYTYHMNMGKAMADAYKANPDNIDALAAAQEHFAEATRIATEQATDQQTVIDKYEAERDKIEAFADTSKSAQKQLNEMAAAHAHAKDEVARLEGEEARTIETIKNLTNSADEFAKALDAADDKTLDASIFKDEELEKQINDLRGIKEQLAGARAEEQKFAAGEELAKKRKEWEEARDSAALYTERATQARVEGEKLSQTDVTPKYDDSVASRMESAFKQIETIASTSIGMDKQIAEIKNYDKAIEDAIKRVKTFDDALKEDPKSEVFKTARYEAVTDAIGLAEAQQRKLNAAIEAIKGTNIDKVALSTGNVSVKLEEAKTRFTNAVTSLRGYEDALKKVSTELGKLEQKSESQRTDADKKKIAELSAEYKRLQEEIQGVIQKGDHAFDDIITEQNTQEVIELGDRYNELEQTIARLENVMDDTHIKTPKIDEAAFVQVVDRIAQAARRMGSEMVQASDQIDSAYRDMRKTVQGTETDYENLRQAAIEYSQSSITSADTMLEMQALGGQLGIATANLEQFGKIASNLDIATDMDAETIALKLGQISNVLGLDIEGTQGFADALVRLGNNMPAQESAIMAVAQRFGAVASTANFSGDEVLAWSAAIAATGQRSEAAATAISNTVSGIEQAVANGGPALKQFAAIAGMSADEFIASWQQGPTETLRNFIEGLKTLKDSDESAVAALENMGITGVRQQQTLLALTQTVDSLDKALVMSADAWGQVSDRWGDAGDAANEAGRKSEGFSGALAILKNNAQNLAASFGDSLVPLMEKAAKVLEFVTDTFNNLPDPVKRLIVELGGLTVVFSTLVPMLKVFSKGITGILSAAGSASSIGGFIAQVTGLATASEAAAGSATILGTALSGPVALGIAAAAGGLLFAISKINEYCEAQETLKNATTGLTTATTDGKAAYGTYIEGAQGSTRSVQELRDALWEATEAQSAYADSVRDAWDGISQSEAQVDTLIQKIGELTNKGSLSAQEQGELNAAVKMFNALTGESIHVIDEQNGKLDVSTRQIKEMGENWKDSLEQDQLFNQYADEVKQIAENEALLADAQEKLAAAESDDWFKSVQDGTLNLSDDIAGLRRDVEQYEDTLASLRAKHEETAASMTPVGNVLGEIEVALNESGHSLADYGGLTDEVCDEIVRVYQDAGSDAAKAIENVLAVLDEFKSGGRDATNIARELEEASKEYNKKRAEKYKVEAQEEYNERKAALDAAYKAAQHGYDAQYRAQQRAFDSQYKAQQKAYDKQYNEAKKAYDKQYDALKKKLDKQYNARKKAYDKQLDALKTSQDAEVKAFEKATDAKLKQMEREYKARVKLLEQEYGSRTSDIDERIKALKGETEAEKKAIETRNEEEKKAELQKAVDDAKSRRTRQEAQQALNDYLQELDAKRNEDARNAEIERLQDQKDALKTELDERKAIIKEQYDDEVAAYKETRAEQLQAIKDANSAEYEAEKERLDGLLEKLKENHTARLESLKESQTAQLEAMKESQTEQLEALKQAQSDQLQAMKDSQTASLEAMKAAQTKELQQLKAAQTAKYNQIKAGNDAEGKAQEKKIQDLYRTQDAGDSKISQAHSRYLYGMEQRMKEMGDNNIRTADEKNETLNQHTEKKLTNLDRMYGSYGNKAPESLATGISKGANNVSYAATGVADAASSPVEGISTFSFTWGSDFVSNFASGIWSGVVDVADAAASAASAAYSYLHHSVPDKGPLADDDKWGGDLIQNLIDGMRDREHDLARQAEKMARIMEDGFDPTLTVDAAYEALDTIGKNRTKSLGSIVETNTAPVVNVTLNMNLSDVSFRNDADIDRLARVMSQEMAAQAARQLAGRLG